MTEPTEAGERERLRKILRNFLMAVMGDTWEIGPAMEMTAPHFEDEILNLLRTEPGGEAEWLERVAKAVNRNRVGASPPKDVDEAVRRILSEMELIGWHRGALNMTEGAREQADEFAALLTEIVRLTTPVEPDLPKIVCLCGSTRFIDRMAVAAWELEKKGHVALSCHLLPSWYTDAADHLAEAQGVAEDLDALHLRKIDLADEVLVIDVDGYIGDSTAREIAYAEELGKPVRYLSEEPMPALSGAPVEPDPWRPMETAPKDGTGILVALDPDANLDHYPPLAFAAWEDGWYDLSTGEYGDWFEPSHWRPLPGAPVEEREPNDG